MDILGFSDELKNRRSIKSAKIPESGLNKKDVLSESCLGLCVE